MRIEVGNRGRYSRGGQWDGMQRTSQSWFYKTRAGSEWLALDGLVARMRSTASQDTLSLSFAVVARK